MENRNTCPICNKIGIKDFLKEDVVCPCCGSDLSVYRKIDILSEYNNNFHKNESRHRWVIGISLIACSLFIFSTFLFSIYSKVDSFCKISQHLYGTESIYKEIIQLNNLTESTLLFPGDSLRIK